MMNRFLRESKWAAGLLGFLRLYLGWTWLSSGFGKVTGEFSAGGFLQAAVANPVVKGEEIVYPMYVSFLENVALPYEGLFSSMVAWGEILVGLALIVGLLTSTATFFGLLMNFSFLLAGTVSINPIMIIIGMIILAAGMNAGRFGLDRLVGPYMKNKWNQKNKLILTPILLNI
ncbi:DoxX family protein [Alkalicoccobacillus porphyridii]|uniref:DoxX family protein n=1 Tax=Alkalicoccobacillus porphyridii TaxID=2597270 RepID=A0A553ZTX2_9BACI|nr:DoxX family protein [Alkalicoccobacillus porphyridii]TSB44929.1 DoxX family protein [Alkalicoccobacillus porphyridii]